MRHAFTRFMLAHGQAPGPGERPWLAGGLAGTVAGLASLPLLNRSGAAASLAEGTGVPSWVVHLLYCLTLILAGVLYGFLFGRAANDRRAGWLLGIAYGFLLWMIGPVALVQLSFERQLVTGSAALGVLGANLIFGLVLGILFRPMYTLVRRPLMKRHTAAAGVVLLLLLSACKREQGSNYPTMGSDSMLANKELKRATGDTTSSAAAASQLSDANIVALLDEANMADSAAGAYALTKATSADVKAFARLMMGDHHALRTQGQQLASRLSLTPEKPPNDPVQPLAMSEMGLLTGSSKQEFDSVYIAQEVDVHKAVLDLAGKAHDAAQSQELKKLIEEARPVIEKHLARAQQIQQKLIKPKA